MKTTSVIRFPVAVLAALLITAAMFSLLHNLTAGSFEAISARPIRKIDWTTVRPDTPVETKRLEKPTLEHPPVIGIETNKDGGDKSLPPTTFVIDPVLPKTTVGGDKPIVFGSDRDVLPVMRVAPVYPQRAADRNIEGWVRVRFNITSTGSVADVIVVASEPQGYFEKAAADAVARWRYNPKVEGAVAVERRGMETLLRFELPSQ